MTSTSTDRRLGVNSGMAIKVPCRAATTAAITLSGEQTVDGVACVTGDRVLVKDQASGVDNGIYSVDTGSWERTTDFDGAYDAVEGTLITVNEGSISAGMIYKLTTADPITIGSTSLSFSGSGIAPTLPLAINQGGTGESTASDARTALGAAASGANTDITSLGGVTIGAAGLSSTVAMTADISPSQITANQNDYNPASLSTTSVMRLTSDASRDITGLQGGADGRLIVIHNVGSFSIVLKDESGSSTAANRFALAADITLATDQSVVLQYDSTSSRWRAVSQPSSASTSSVTTPPAVRQTVLSGPVDTSGLSSFGGSTGSTTVTASGTLVATCAAGGNDNRTGSITNPSWTGLSTNGTMYLYLDIASDGTVTTGSTTNGGTVAPNYRWGGADVVTNLVHTYNIQEAVMKVGNGATAAQVYRVFVGQVTVTGGVTSALVWYALMGRYDSGWTATLPNSVTSVSKNSNLGVFPLNRAFVMENTTTDSGYSVGDQLQSSGAGEYTGINISGPAVWATTNTVGGSFGGTSCIAAIPKGGGASAALTVASWKYKFIAERGW